MAIVLQSSTLRLTRRSRESLEAMSFSGLVDRESWVSNRYASVQCYAPAIPPSVRYTTGIARPRCADRLPNRISKMAVSTVSGGGPTCPELRTFRWEVPI